MLNYINKDILFNVEKIKTINIPIEFKPQKNNSTKEYILSVCRMSHDKMYIKYLISDFINFVDKNEIFDLELKLVGDGPLFDEVRNHVYNFNSIHKNQVSLIGTKSGKELQNLFKHCWIYVGMGTTLINAGLYGKPSIISTFDKKYMNLAIGLFGYKNNDSFGQINEDCKLNTFCFYIKNLTDHDFYRTTSKKTYDFVSDNFLLKNIMSTWMKEYTCISSKKIIFYEYLRIISKTSIFTHKLWRKLKYAFI